MVRSSMTRRGLIIVDVQVALFSTLRYDADGLVGRLNIVADRLRAERSPVIVVQHCGPAGDALHPSRPGHAIHQGLTIGEGDIRIAKKSCDAFLDTSLTDVLASLSVSEVIITGVATEFCVDTTVRSALARGFTTVVPTDGHTTADRPHLSAAKIIEHHNETWRGLISPAGPAQIMPCTELIG